MFLIDRNNLNFELKSESLEDLWVLSEFIAPEDRIFATTERKVKVGGETSTKQVKKIIFVELLVKKIKFESDILRVSGEIQNETEFTTIGQSHTLSFSVGDKIKVMKRSLLKFEEKLLKRSIESKSSHNLLVLLDKDEVVVSEFGDFSYKVLFEQGGLGSKKRFLEEVNEEEQKFKLIGELLKRDYSKVVFAGPGLWKEKLAKYVKDKVGVDAVSFAFPDASSSSVQKAIAKVQESGVLAQSKVAEESDVVNELLRNVEKGQKAIYGMKETFEAVGAGRAQKFLVSTKVIGEAKDDGSYLELNEVMRNVEQLNGELVIVSSKNEPGRILDGLGGIGAVLRY